METNLSSFKNAIPDRELTPLLVEKWDKDLATIEALNKLLIDSGNVFVLRGGMATEAYTDGKQKRAHNDVDGTIHILNIETETSKSVPSWINTITEAEDTNWKLFSQKPEKIEYREDNEELPFFDRRRLELYFHQGLGEQYETRQLVDSQGNAIEVHVVELSDLVAGKVRKLFMANNPQIFGQPERDTNKSDYVDLKRLIVVPEYDKEKVLLKMSHLIKKLSDPHEQRLEAEREHAFVVGLLDEVEVDGKKLSGFEFIETS